MENIKFSIIVPIFNSEKYLVECLDSVINQTYQNFELILVDNNSKDDSIKICEEYKRNNDKISIFYCKEAGVALTRQVGIYNATGNYIMFLDSDDWWDLNTLQIMYENIIATNADIIVFHHNIYNSNGSVTKSDFITKAKQFTTDNKKDLFIEAVKSAKWNSICFKCIKLEIVKKVPKFEKNVAMGEDAYISYNAMNIAENIIVIENNLYYYRVNVNSASYVFELNYIEDNMFVQSNRYSLLKQYTTDKDVLDRFIVRSINNFAPKILLALALKISYHEVMLTLNQIYTWDLYKIFLNDNLKIDKNNAKIMNDFADKKYNKLKRIAKYKKIVFSIRHTIKKIIKK